MQIPAQRTKFQILILFPRKWCHGVPRALYHLLYIDTLTLSSRVWYCLAFMVIKWNDRFQMAVIDMDIKIDVNFVKLILYNPAPTLFPRPFVALCFSWTYIWTLISNCLLHAPSAGGPTPHSWWYPTFYPTASDQNPNTLPFTYPSNQSSFHSTFSFYHISCLCITNPSHFLIFHVLLDLLIFANVAFCSMSSSNSCQMPAWSSWPS